MAKASYVAGFLLAALFFIGGIQLCACRNSTLGACIQRDRNALLKFKGSLQDPTDLLSSWEGKDCCHWKGVSCDENTGHVIKLNLSRSYWGSDSSLNMLDKRLGLGKVNTSLMELKHLKYLNLSGNNFQGCEIPKFFGSLNKLRYLDLSRTNFSGKVPHQLGNLTSLKVLNLGSYFDNRRAYVDNFKWSSSLLSLQHLDVSGVHLGSAHNLMEVLTRLPSLQNLQLSYCGISNIHFQHALVNSTSIASIQFLDLSLNALQTPILCALQNMSSLKVLEIFSNSFTSSVPLCLGNLKSLVTLNLGYNTFDNIEGGISSLLNNYCHLKSLELSGNQFHGEAFFGTGQNLSRCVMHSLESLSLGSNEIGGKIPNWLGQLRGLKHLDLSNSLLHGQIPSSLWNLSNLKNLDVGDNQLSGVVPRSLGQLENLETFVIATNSLEGTLSEVHFSNLSRLKTLDVGYNYNLTFKVSSDWIPPFSLTKIAMENCRTGGFEFLQWLRSTQKEVEHLSLANTSIVGSFPMWLQPRFYLDLSMNQLSGPLPSSIGDDIPSLEDLLISNNLINGSIPNSICRINSLSSLDLSKNMLHGQIPHCGADSLASEFIDLSSNKLSGTIPASICNRPTLEFFHVNNNSLSGMLPLALRNCTHLISLALGENRLSGVIPTWIGENYSHLQILSLRENTFTGSIPLSLCRLSRLRILDIGGNQLMGKIPLCFNNLSGMSLTRYLGALGFENQKLVQVMKGQYLEYTSSILIRLVSMDLSSNNLVGRIPEQLTTLEGLVGLNLSRNHLSGSIPQQIGNMKQLLSLDFSDNQISGRIPDSMSSLTFLSYLNLSYNNLSGTIPKGNQLQTLTDPTIYAGNVQLCGDPLPNKCAGNKEPVQPPINTGAKDEEQGESKSEKFWFYFVVSCGYATGLWGVIWILSVKKNWRIAYFRYADKAKDWVLMMVAVQVARLKRKMEINNNGTE